MEKPSVVYMAATEFVCNQPKDYIDAYAEDTAKRLGLKPGGDLVELTARLGGKIHYKSIFDDADLNTIFVHGPKDFDIVLPDLSTPRRDRFTIAHELGHYFLHSWMGKHPLKASRNGSDRAEWEANWFAAGLIMPVKAFRAAHAKLGSLAVLADMFAVSEHAAGVRCKALGLRACVEVG